MTTSATGRRQAALVYNPIKVDEKHLRARVRDLSREAGWEHPAFYPTTVDDAGQQATSQALARDVDVVLVAGGDGTVRAVSEAIAGSAVPLAILPSGTGNLLARNLGLPWAPPDLSQLLPTPGQPALPTPNPKPPSNGVANGNGQPNPSSRY